MLESLKAFIDFVGGAIQHYIVSKVVAVTVRGELRLNAFRAYVVEGRARTATLGRLLCVVKGPSTTPLILK